MNIRPIKKNLSEVTFLRDGEGSEEITLLFSYQTPVAARVRGKLYKTSTRFSSTTSRHISTWCNGQPCTERPQEWIESLSS